MRITSQGQIALPQEVTEKLGFLPDTEIEYQIKGNLLLLRKREKSEKGSALISLMKGSANTGMTTDQIMKLTRGE